MANTEMENRIEIGRKDVICDVLPPGLHPEASQGTSALTASLLLGHDSIWAEKANIRNC